MHRRRPAGAHALFARSVRESYEAAGPGGGGASLVGYRGALHTLSCRRARVVVIASVGDSAPLHSPPLGALEVARSIGA